MTDWDLQLRVAEHLWTVHNWQVTAKMVDDAEHLARVSYSLVENHALEHRAAVGQQWPGWREHGHDPALEPMSR